MGERIFVDCWVLHPSYHQYPWWWWCDGTKTWPVWWGRSRAIKPLRSATAFVGIGHGSWRPFWFDHIFCSMIFGRVMANIRHGGGSHTVAFWQFWRLSGVVFVFFWQWRGGGQKTVPLFLWVPLILGYTVTTTPRHFHHQKVWHATFTSASPLKYNQYPRQPITSLN